MAGGADGLSNATVGTAGRLRALPIRKKGDLFMSEGRFYSRPVGSPSRKPAGNDGGADPIGFESGANASDGDAALVRTPAVQPCGRFPSAPTFIGTTVAPVPIRSSPPG